MTVTAAFRSRGISLVEMLIALVILGMMAALSLGGLRLGVRTWETVGQRVGTESRERIVRTFLRGALSQAMAVHGTRRDGGVAPHLLFEGDEDKLSMIAPLADHLGLGGAQWIELSVEDAEDFETGRRLVLARVPFDRQGADAAEPGEMERHVLLEGLSAVRFSYLRISEGGAREWVGEWADEPFLPALVRLSVERQGSAPPWPPLVVPLRVTAASGGR